MSNNPVLLIIGNGVSGITAAREARKIAPELSIKIISEESKYFYSRTALMYIYMGHMKLENTEVYERNFYKKNNLELVFDTVESINTEGSELILKKGGSLNYDYLLVATGSKPNFFNWPGQDSGRVQGMYSLQDLESLENLTNKNSQINKAVIVGGGLIGIELAEMLHTRGIHIQFLIRENSYWDNVLPPEESAMINQEIEDHGIVLSRSVGLKEIVANSAGDAVGVVTDAGEKIGCEFVGITAGVSPNIDIIKKSNIKVSRGVLVDEFMQTSKPRVYAVGDCAQFKKSDGEPGHLEQLWYTGKMHGRVAGYQIAADFLRSIGKADRADKIDVSGHDRGIWFNSAKFLTIEYQTYGFVPAVIEAEYTHVWSCKKTKKLIRIVWEINAQGEHIVTGMNALGIRFRQSTWFDWICEGASVEDVVEQLEESVFDPEFYSSRVCEFQESYFQRFEKEAGVVA